MPSVPPDSSYETLEQPVRDWVTRLTAGLNRSIANQNQTLGDLEREIVLFVTFFETPTGTSKPADRCALLVSFSSMVLLGLLVTARADVVLNNLGTSGINANFGMVSLGQGQAIKFATGAHVYSLDSITVRIAGDSFWSFLEPRSATVSLRLYEDEGGRPSGLLSDFGLRTLTGSNVVEEVFTAPTKSLLTPNTAYWVAIVKQAQTENTRTTWYSGAVTGGTVFTDAQSGWQLFHGAIGTRDDGHTWSQSTSFEGAIQIAASIVPEPTSPAVFSLFCLAMLVKRVFTKRLKVITGTLPGSASIQ